MQGLIKKTIRKNNEELRIFWAFTSERLRLNADVDFLGELLSRLRREGKLAAPKSIASSESKQNRGAHQKSSKTSSKPVETLKPIDIERDLALQPSVENRLKLAIWDAKFELQEKELKEQDKTHLQTWMHLVWEEDDGTIETR